MNIAKIDYSLETTSLDIYLSGCTGPHCPNCHNPELWEFNVGLDYKEFLTKIDSYIINFKELITNIMIYGGEPLDQNYEKLEDLLSYLDTKHRQKSIWLWTKYNIDEVPDFVKTYCQYIKTGRYLEEKKCNYNFQWGVQLSTSNQIIHKKGKDF